MFITDADNREVLEYDGASGAIQRWYAYGLGPNDVLNQSNVVTGTRAALIPDIQGSVIASLDSATATLTKIGYLPYGKSATASGPFGFTGQRIDPETNGLYYYRARMYHPAWGRFMQVDPLGTLTANPQAGVTGTGNRTNLYVYTGNDPLNGTDQLGLYTFQIGGTFSFSYGLSFSFSGGIVVDTQGNAAFYTAEGAGLGLGPYVKLGVSPTISTAPTIYDLQTNVDSIASLNTAFTRVNSFVAGAGVGASVDLGTGFTQTGDQYKSYGLTVGSVTGVGISSQYQATQLWDAGPPK